MVEDPDSEGLGRQDQNGTAAVKGRATITVKDVMEAFDSLPKAVRVALANSNHQWAPHWAKFALVYARLVMEQQPNQAIVDRIARADREETLRREAQLFKRQG